MSDLDRILVVCMIALEIAIYYFILRQSESFVFGISVLIISIGLICVIGWLIDGSIQRRLQPPPDITIEKLNTKLRSLQVIDDWGKTNHLNLTTGEKLDLLKTARKQRFTVGTMVMAFVSNIAIIALSATTLLLSERNSILQNLFQNATSNAPTSSLAVYQIQTLPSEIAIIIAIAFLYVITLTGSFWVIWYSIREEKH